ncbi:MAG: hypothetical protein PHX93_02160 [Candidatus Peribacteraceae bacterium]|jgi:hypothetical protein|nr:hypothetical protein [Candidatus Peribacteraceae bacterium]
MNTITLQDLKSRGSKAIPDGKVVYLIVNSKVKAAIVPPDQMEALVEAFEELEDIQAIEAAKNEPLYTWEQVFPEDKKKKKR